MDTTQYNLLFSFIWNIANDVLVHAFNKGDYKKVILPMMVLRRLDILLEPTHSEVLETKERLSQTVLPEEVVAHQLMEITGYPFFNTSRFTMKDLRGITQGAELYRCFIEYLDGFSPDVCEIIDKFELKQQAKKLHETSRLGAIIQKFTDPEIHLGKDPILDAYGHILYPGVDNHTMGTLFEQLLRKFNEEHSVTEAGEHFTPRDYVALLADVAIRPVIDQLSPGRYTIYDGACGTGGILSLAEQRLQEIATAQDKNIDVQLYGQELQPETYATCKADLMLSSSMAQFSYQYESHTRPLFSCGSTISDDRHQGMKFDFCISNPPFGTPWKEDLKAWGLKDKKEVSDPRFLRPDSLPLPPNTPKGAITESSTNFIPNIGDAQMLFLANNLSRLKDTPLGTRIVEVHNGSSLFTGNAGGGESNLRRYIIENDMLEAIIAMPENSFYNTGIATYVWIVTNRKAEHRKGLVQLIDASEIKSPLRKNLGEKNCQTDASNREEIYQLLSRFEETPQSKIFPNEEFGYWEVRVDRPLRLRIDPTADLSTSTLKPNEVVRCQEAMAKVPADTPLDDWDTYAKALRKVDKLPKGLLNKLRNAITTIDPSCQAVTGEADPALRDTEQIPLRYEGGVEAFMQCEVLPYSPDAYIVSEETKVGYELSFTKYFYKPAQLRSTKEIANDLHLLEAEADGLLSQILDL